jgi:dihydroorotate dehydrogenase
MSTKVVEYLSYNSEGKIPIIASGGIFTAADAKEKIKAGASLLQLYTGFIYQGPALIKKLNKALAER